MKKRNALLTLIFLSILHVGTYAQDNYLIRYSSNQAIYDNSILAVNNKESSYKLAEQAETTTEKKGNLMNLNSCRPFEFMYYNKSEFVYLFEGPVKGNTRAAFTEKALIRGWEITDEKKTILGHICIKATRKNATHRFEAWFSDELTVTGGPMRCNDLPGLVLEYTILPLSNERATINFIATLVEKTSLNEIQRPHPNAPIISPESLAIEQIYFLDKATYQMIKNYGKDVSVAFIPFPDVQ